MSNPIKSLFKTTIVIWSDEDPTHKYEIIDLAREATDGMMYCSDVAVKEVKEPKKDPDWDGTEFFDET
jgi:hypothetical protein